MRVPKPPKSIQLSDRFLWDVRVACGRGGRESLPKMGKDKVLGSAQSLNPPCGNIFPRPIKNIASKTETVHIPLVPWEARFDSFIACAPTHTTGKLKFVYEAQESREKTQQQFGNSRYIPHRRNCCLSSRNGIEFEQPNNLSVTPLQSLGGRVQNSDASSPGISPGTRQGGLRTGIDSRGKAVLRFQIDFATPFLCKQLPA